MSPQLWIHGLHNIRKRAKISLEFVVFRFDSKMVAILNQQIFGALPIHW